MPEITPTQLSQLRSNLNILSEDFAEAARFAETRYNVNIPELNVNEKNFSNPGIDIVQSISYQANIMEPNSGIQRQNYKNAQEVLNQLRWAAHRIGAIDQMLDTYEYQPAYNLSVENELYTLTPRNHANSYHIRTGGPHDLEEARRMINEANRIMERGN
jgi:hypothetical protein